MADLAIRFPTGISYGAVSTIRFKTDVVTLNSGHENRNQNWSWPLSAWDAAKGCKNDADRIEIITFWRIAKGRANTFLWQDPSDYEVQTSEGGLGNSALGTGFPTHQLVKSYSNSAGAEYRTIRHPVVGTLAIYKNASLQTAGASPGNYAVDYTTGVVTFVATSIKSISAITKANPGQITATAHGFSNGQVVYLSSIGGMTQLNGTVVTVTIVDPNNFTIGVNTTGYGTFTSGGTAALYPQPADALVWSGQFDVRVRFDTDELSMVKENLKFFRAQNIPVIEVRAP